MFNLGFLEIFLLAIIALLVVGPEKLPKLARDVARFINDVKRTTNTITQDITKAIDEENFQKKLKKLDEEGKVNTEEPDLESSEQHPPTEDDLIEEDDLHAHLHEHLDENPNQNFDEHLDEQADQHVEKQTDKRSDETKEGDKEKDV